MGHGKNVEHVTAPLAKCQYVSKAFFTLVLYSLNALEILHVCVKKRPSPAGSPPAQDLVNSLSGNHEQMDHTYEGRCEHMLVNTLLKICFIEDFFPSQCSTTKEKKINCM